MKDLCITVNIIRHSDGSTTCWLGQQVNDGKVEITNLELDKANKLMWELKLAGGEKDVVYTRDPKLYYTRVIYFMMY